jgi:2-methylisocitrate lyase-like PEP mutase family enzyme
VEGGRSPSLTYDELAEPGFALVIMPITALLAATGAMVSTLARLKADGTPVHVQHELPAFADFTDLIGPPEILDLQQRHT